MSGTQGDKLVKLIIKKKKKCGAGISATPSWTNKIKFLSLVILSRLYSTECTIAIYLLCVWSGVIANAKFFKKWRAWSGADEETLRRVIAWFLLVKNGRAAQNRVCAWKRSQHTCCMSRQFWSHGLKYRVRCAFTKILCQLLIMPRYLEKAKTPLVQNLWRWWATMMLYMLRPYWIKVDWEPNWVRMSREQGSRSMRM